ncbi:quinone-dependent dihydroorotate dehydrogenase [Actinocorallia longicatena]|uniref:Dihydroorotate dehydrogenase (quinone) n=1 Tax=Actinocorallia longicatena TaxID=111803 RepID=A0ABP6QI16_9ACTN
MYELLFSSVLKRTDPERIHHLTIGALKAVQAVPGLAGLLRRAFGANGRPIHALGLEFPGPLGLAAGFDKDAVAYEALAGFGFSHIEVGTLTGEPQPGNPRKRLFRLIPDRAVINRMGFNNGGAAAAAPRLARRRNVIVGVNIGKTKAVPEAEAAADYVKSTKLLSPLADYLVVNVSSPNTPGLRDLQAVEHLRPLLQAVQEAKGGTPLLVKIAPDLADADIDAVADLALELGLDGIIATNTTIGRDGLSGDPEIVKETGGLSGAPLKARSVEVLKRLKARTGDGLVLISVGGIETAADVRARLAAGATLVQGYTGMIYGGPLWAYKINRELRRG